MTELRAARRFNPDYVAYMVGPESRKRSVADQDIEPLITEDKEMPKLSEEKDLLEKPRDERRYNPCYQAYSLKLDEDGKPVTPKSTFCKY